MTNVVRNGRQFMGTGKPAMRDRGKENDYRPFCLRQIGDDTLLRALWREHPQIVRHLVEKRRSA